MYNPRLKNKESLVDMSTYGTDSRKRMHSTVLIGDHCEYHPMFKEGDILDANATLNLIQDTYDENKIFETFSEEGRQIAERLDRIESISDENNTQIVNEITEIDNKFSTQTENIRNDINSILQLIPELKRVVDINLVSNNDGKKTYLVEKQNGELSYIEITDGEKGDPFVYNDFTQEQLESLKVKGDKGDKGDRGISVAEVKQTKLSYADKGENIWRMTLNDGTISEFVVRNGSGAEYVGSLEQDISTESTRARDAEAALQLNINLLALQQQQDVQRLSTEIDTKISDVIGTAPAALDTLGEIATKLAYNDDAVASIVSAISTETTNRQQSESVLLNNIDTVSTALNNLDQTLTSRIGAEESRALLAEQLISSDLVTLSGIVNTNNTDLSAGLSTEQSRAEAAETALNLAITQEVSDRQTAISEETTRALTVEASLQSDITVEYQRASTAENTLDGKIDLEISDRQSAISYLSNNKADKATTIAGYGITNAYTKTEVDSLIQTEENRATAAEQEVAGDLSDEITRATTAEQTISGNLSDEITRATTAEQTNATAIQNEITRATAAELANAAAIQANTTAFNSFKDSIRTDGTLGTTITSTERTSWNNKVDGSSVGVANGVATLDSGGKVPSSQLPSYVDDVEEYSSLSNFPTTGESGKIYVDTTTNLTYRWSGSTYVAISSDLALGETSSTAYAGDKGKAVTDNFNTHAANTDIHVTAAEKEYWNNKVNTPSYSAPTAKTLTYTGSAQDLLNAGSSTAGTILYSTDETNWSTTIPQGTNVNTYTVYWRFVGSEVTYVDSTEIKVTIVKGNASYTAPTAKSGLVYDGTAKNLLNEGSTSGGTISYSSDGIEWSTSIPQGTNATDYTVYWKLTGDSNHNDIDSTSIAVNIAKVTPTVTAPTAKVLIYNTSAQVLANNGSTNFGTLQYSSDNSTWSSNIPNETNAGDYSVYYKVVGDSNINDVASTAVSCAISKVTPTVTAPTAKSLTYNTQSQVLANAGSTDYGTIKYSLDGVDYSTTIPSATNVGFYTLYYKVDGDSNINNVSAQSVSCLIDAKTVSSPTITLATNSYTYDGSAKQPSVTSVEDGEVLIPSSEYTIEYSNNTNAGTGTVTISDANGGNYTVSGSTTFTINKAAGSVTIAPVATNNTYNGSAKVLATAGSGTGTMYYSLDNVSFSTSIPTRTNAGSYTIYYYSAESANYNQSATSNISATIDKANGSITEAPTAKSLTYNGEAQTLVNAGSGTGTMYYSLSPSSGFSTTIPTGTNGGTYTVYYYAAESANYNQGETGNISVSIGKANRTVTISGNQTSMAPSQSNTITVTATGNPASSLISVTSSNTAVATISGTTVNAVGGGTTTITATVASDANYNSGSSNYTLTVAWANGIYAAYADGSMRTAENADTNAIGVAVITDNCKFIIDKTNNTNAAWDNNYSTNGAIAGCFATDDLSTAKTDYTGVSNTNAIAAVASGGEAAKYCRSCSKTIAGKTVYGYLGACGEWQTTYDNKTTVDSIMSTIGGTAIISTHYWTSTLCLSNSRDAWGLLWVDGNVVSTVKHYIPGLVRPLYEIS